jgi:hypothetical protein
MEIIPETDKVIRNFLPTVLDAAGRTECAQELRDLDPIIDLKSIIGAAIRLQKLSEYVQEETDIDIRWVTLVEDSLFWCQAAVWAAARKDTRSFRDYIHRTTEAMKEGLHLITYN